MYLSWAPPKCTIVTVPTINIVNHAITNAVTVTANAIATAGVSIQTVACAGILVLQQFA